MVIDYQLAAAVNAAIVTKKLIYHGEIQGDVTTSEEAVLKRTAVQTGSVTMPSLVVENGSIFNGSCTVKRETVAELPQNETGQEGTGSDDLSVGVAQQRAEV